MSLLFGILQTYYIRRKYVGTQGKKKVNFKLSCPADIEVLPM